MDIVKYAWPGGYPMFYLDSEDSCLCADCALKQQNDPDNEHPIVACDANWEDPELHCDECSERIESAYAEPEER